MSNEDKSPLHLSGLKYTTIVKLRAMKVLTGITQGKLVDMAIDDLFDKMKTKEINKRLRPREKAALKDMVVQLEGLLSDPSD